MDTADWGLQFLDLSGATEDDQSRIERVLSTPNKCLQLPWSTSKEAGEDLEVEQEWSQVQYDEQEGAPDVDGDPGGGNVEVGEEPQQSQRNPVYPSMVYIVPPGVYVPSIYNSPQHYVYQDIETRQPHTRPGKKVDKKNESNYAMPYVVPYPQAMYPPMFHHVPVYADYSHGYVPGPEQGASFTEEGPYVPASVPAPMEMPEPEVKEDPPLVEPYTEFPTHEHLCYHANVTLKPPKKKQPEEVVVEPPPVDPIVPLPVESSPPVAEPVLQQPILPERVEPIPVVSDPDLSSTHGGNKDFPGLGSSGEPAATLPANQNVKSWVSLFRPGQPAPTPQILQTSSDVKPRPLARVSPFDKNGTSSFTSKNEVTSSPSLTPKIAPPSHSTPFANGTPLADDIYLHRVGEILYTYKLDHRAVSLQPRGLTNRSNWCYVNAILQALIACPSFYNLMKALPVPTKKRTPSSRAPIIDALVEFVNLFPALPPNARPAKRDKRSKEDATDLPAGSSFEPTGIYKVLDKIRGDNGFTVEGRQEDAEEFLSCLLNGLNDEMFEISKLVDSRAPGMANGDSGDSETGDGWKEKMPRKNKGSVTRRTVCGKTPISDIFRGQLRNRVQRAGDEYTDNVQPFFTLQLDVEKASSVKEALELLVGKDPLEGMTCSKTNQEIEAWTQISLEDLPLILILHLKCFDYKQDGCSKIMKSVAFSVELKVDPKLMSVNKSNYVGKQRNYKLVAVVYHDGKEATKGHYVTDAYHVGLGCWIRYDDGNVRSVSEESVLKPKSPRVPYLLYYRRADTVSVPVHTQNPPPRP